MDQDQGAAGPQPDRAPGAARSWTGGLQALLVGVLFCLSGVPALVYQLAWQRILALHSGVGIYSVAMIVAAYMAGLGAGSLAGGRLSRRLGATGSLLAFAALELGIGLFAALSCTLYYDLLYARAPWLYDTGWRAGLCHFAALLPPTFLMGMSLPLLVRAMVHDSRTASRTIGYLYGVNVLGAAVGALVTPWLLIRYLGIPGAVWVGVACNLLVGVGALALGWAFARPLRERDREETPGLAGPGAPGGARLAPRLWVTLYALSGFCAIALEILWFRLIDVGVKSTAFTFGTVLAVYLLGLAIGSLVGAAGLVGRRDPLKAFLVCQCLILLYAGAAVLLLARAPVDLWGYRSFFAYCAACEGLVPGEDGRAALAALYGGLPAFLYAVPTALMGISFVVLQRAVQDDRRTSGHKVGVLQSANIAGCMAGSLLVGLILLERWGTAGTLRALVVLGVLFALLGLWYAGRPRGAFVPLGLGLLAVAAALPDQEGLWRRLHGIESGPAFFDEDATGLAAITPERDGRWRVSVNGKAQSSLPFGGDHSWLGALPVTLHPAPKRVAIIGLGSGDTAWAAACRPETEEVTVFEICAPEARLLRRLSASTGLPELGRFLDDPRVRVVVADGRNALWAADQTYDLIEADAIRPSGAYSGNLYSVEFFELCARRLNRGGLICTWAPTPRVRETFRQAVPHVLALAAETILLGSNEPIELDRAAWDRRLRSGPVADYLGPAVVADCVREIAQSKLKPRLSGPTAQLNRDLFPRDEFLVPFRKERRPGPGAPYEQLVLDIQEVVGGTVPPGATVLVISKGDDELLRLDGRRGRHFPQNEHGEYLGYPPADSREVIDQLEKLRAGGAGFLVIPREYLWWLEHYIDFRRHLEARYRVAFRQEEVCVIFDLR